MSRPDPWFRMYHATLDNPKVQKLPGEQFKAWVNLLCLACRHAGRLPNDADIAFALRVSETKVKPLLKRFIDAGLIDADGDGLVMHDWDTLQFKSDVSTDRVKQHRQRKRNVSGNAAATPTETHQSRAEQIRPDIPKDSSSIVLASTSKLKNQKALSKEEIRARWQSNICKEAQATMTPDKFAAFVEAWANGDRRANAIAEQLDKQIKARKALGAVA